jgi:chloramphenicol 3-O phosphotransferase
MGGGVILLNGTSSAGKTTLALAVQEAFAAARSCWLVVGIDDWLAKLPPDWWFIAEHQSGSFAADGVSFTRGPDDLIHLRLGPVGRALLDAYRRTAVAVARSGLDVVVDDCMVDDEHLAGWRTALAGLDVLWVRVDCPVEVAAERERARGDRLIGIVREQATHVHDGIDYDVVADTSTASPAELAAAVVAAWNGRR